MNIAVCPKCKGKGIKVLTPVTKKGLWFMCQDCGFSLSIVKTRNPDVLSCHIARGTLALPAVRRIVEAYR